MPSFPAFLTFAQVAARLHVPVASVRYWVSVGKLAAFKPGRHPLIREDDLLAFVEGASVAKVRADRARRTRTARKSAA